MNRDRDVPTDSERRLLARWVDGGEAGVPSTDGDQGPIECLDRAWQDLDLPPATSIPPGFVIETARLAMAREPLVPSLQSSWSRLAAAASLVLGLAVGAWAGSSLGDVGAFSAAASSRQSGRLAEVDSPLEELGGNGMALGHGGDESLVESYWSALADEESGAGWAAEARP